jgi:pimeloyl-ACP methyl ester carboxylesterase
LKKTFVLLPGAGGASAYWQCVLPLLERAGFDAVAVDFPADDDDAGLDEYCARTLAAIGARDDVVLVAQSLGGFTAPLVASRASSVRAIAFVNAMIPRPGETSGAWWGNTGSEEARAAAAKAGGYSAKFDLHEYFLHDLPEEFARAIERDSRPQSKKIFDHPCAFERWPDIPVRVFVGTEDRFFPRDFQHRVAKERLGGDVAIEDVRGGHLVALSNPVALAERLIEFARKT